MKEKQPQELVTSLEKASIQLQQPRKENVFPLTATHRKELRQLKEKTIGNLKTQIRFVKNKKKEEYIENRKKSFAELKKQQESKIDLLNTNFEVLKEDIIRLIESFKELEKEECNLDFVDINRGYNSISQLNIDTIQEEVHRIYKFSEAGVKGYLEQEFNKQFESDFEKLYARIDEMENAYEEAINFGDLEQVKRLYYLFKQADVFVQKVQNLEV